MKALKTFVKWVLVLLVLTAVGIYDYGKGQSEKADGMSLSPPPDLERLAAAAGVRVPQYQAPDCSIDNMTSNGPTAARMGKALAATSLNSMISDVRSATDAALRFEQQGNTQMLTQATRDAVDRWADVLRLRRTMDCETRVIQRGQY